MFEKYKHLLHYLLMAAISFLTLLLVMSFRLQADTCDDWFNKTKIPKNEQCNSLCLTAQTDLSTFLCPQSCDKFCNPNVDAGIFLNYYGLTKDEIVFCKSRPSVCLQAYALTWEAESVCSSIYGKSGKNDESDACRHYYWSIFLSRKLGLKQAKIILNAHENAPDEPDAEKQMDLKNNFVGITYYKAHPKATDEELLQFFKDGLKSKKFSILEPKYANNGGLP